MQPDARAVENPILSIFDLSEDVAKQAPVIRSMVRYASAFIIVWLIISFFLILALLSSGNLILFLIMVALFVVGLVAIILLRRMDRFFKYYVARQRSIKAVRDLDPMVYAPQGKTSTERFVTYLRAHNPAMFGRNVEAAMPGIVQGNQGSQYSFDAFIREPAGGLWKLFGLGRHGFAIYVKRFDSNPRGKEVQAFKRAVEDVTARTKIPPTRVVVLWERKEGEVLDDKVYSFIMTQPVRERHRFRKIVCNLEVVSETEGTYDFIPFMVNGSPGRRTRKA